MLACGQSEIEQTITPVILFLFLQEIEMGLLTEFVKIVIVITTK